MTTKNPDIKRTIIILCNHLNDLYDLSFKPEHFRLAKFNKSEENVIPKLWNLINKLTIDEPVLSVEKIKLYYKSQNYKSICFYDLPSDMADGSRELLLAFGYVFRKGLDSFIAQLLEKRYNEFKVNKISTFKTELDTHLSHPRSEEDYKHFKHWVEGKVDQNLRNINEYRTHTAKMLKSLKCSTDLNLNSIELYEILALYSSQYSEHFLSTSEKVIRVLENHLRWLNVAPTFWKWMISVIQQKQKSCGDK